MEPGRSQYQPGQTYIEPGSSQCKPRLTSMEPSRSQHQLPQTSIEPSNAQQPTRRASTKNALFLPDKYDGLSCCRKFLEQFRLWASFHSMEDDQSLVVSFALLMTDSARVWYRSLKPSDLTNFEHLARLFIIRFNEDKKIWQRTAELMAL